MSRKLEKWLLRRLRNGANPGEITGEILLENRGSLRDLAEFMAKYRLDRSDFRWKSTGKSVARRARN